ncbi:hypothetical protein IAT38_000458 [Cryptococcus sp. DSM 104549]
MFTSSTLTALLLVGAGICARAEGTPLGERAGGAVVGDVLAGGYTDGITVSAENVTQCGYATISWTGAAAPATLEIGKGGYYVGTTSVANLTAGWDNTTQWLVTQPAGTDLIFQIVGADGKTGYVQNIQVGEGEDGCLGNGTVGGNGTATNGSSTASESSTETASSTDAANSTLSAASSDTTTANISSTTSGTTTLPSSAAASASSASQVIVTVGGSASSGAATPASGTTTASSGDSSASLLAANDSTSTAGASTTSAATSGAEAARSFSGAVLAGAAGVALGAVAGLFA